MISGAVLFLSYVLINRNAAYRESNKTLEESIKEMNIETEKIIKLQKHEIDIANRPPLSRDDLIRWMRTRKNNP